ncbi:hypothetical protein LSH36_677g01008 [Paralvinella palmiformis]|uniref:Neurotransmitter-gated ion-channel ligand-binding domain-containing protein n=1 Tax=Paralvinella palmiformis TaxID=53620 RepID=A0AAD9J2J9_9ANNE|nr:hypothetical protein LSH36_677g01008 [Paralvinella palmiformis]
MKHPTNTARAGIQSEHRKEGLENLAPTTTRQELTRREESPYMFRNASHEERLLAYLFRDYDPVARAVMDTNKTVVVTVDFVLLRIHGLDERSQVLTTTGLVIASWCDIKGHAVYGAEGGGAESGRENLTRNQWFPSRLTEIMYDAGYGSSVGGITGTMTSTMTGITCTIVTGKDFSYIWLGRRHIPKDTMSAGEQFGGNDLSLKWQNDEWAEEGQKLDSSLASTQ